MRVHFIGIGGIGVSALARYFLWQDARVSGSDLSPSEITDGLKKEGIKVFIGPHKAGNVPKGVDMVIYSPAVQPDNPELKQAKKFQVSSFKSQVKSYPKALGELTKKYFTIAVSGSHGKSTTTAMLANILIKAGLDPTVIIGTKLKEFGNSALSLSNGPALSLSNGPALSLSNGSNFRPGKSKYLVIEADEWNASFLNYWPKMIVLTNIDREHLDYYKNLNHIIKTFREYAGRLPEEGTLVANRDDANIRRMLKSKILRQRRIRLGRKSTKSKINLKFKIQNYSIKQKEAEILREILKVPGEHNVYNALAALSAARVLEIPDKTSFKALSEYRGAWRRFELLGKFKGADIISDYAHHPTEIRATLAATRQRYPKKEIWCVFQPHQIQRTEFLFKDFASAFGDADRIFLLDIYGVAGREKSAHRRRGVKVSSEKLAREIKKRGKDVQCVGNAEKAISLIRKEADKNKTVLIVGAGDIWKVGKKLLTRSL